MIYLLILAAVGLTSAGQILQKIGAERYLKEIVSWRQVGRALVSREIILALACLAGGTLLWLAVLYHMDVSKAFPFVSLGFVLVMLAARLYFHEAVPWFRWFGVVLITAGISLVAQT